MHYLPPYSIESCQYMSMKSEMDYIYIPILTTFLILLCVDVRLVLLHTGTTAGVGSQIGATNMRSFTDQAPIWARKSKHKTGAANT